MNHRFGGLWERVWNATGLPSAAGRNLGRHSAQGAAPAVIPFEGPSRNPSATHNIAPSAGAHVVSPATQFSTVSTHGAAVAAASHPTAAVLSPMPSPVAANVATSSATVGAAKSAAAAQLPGSSAMPAATPAPAAATAKSAAATSAKPALASTTAAPATKAATGAAAKTGAVAAAALAKTPAAPATAVAAQTAGYAKTAAASHTLGSIAMGLLIPVGIVAFAAFWLLTASGPRNRAPFRRPRWIPALRTLRTLAIPVTLTALSALLLIAGATGLYTAVTSRSVPIAAGRPTTETHSLIQALQKVSSTPPTRISLTFLAPGTDSENLQRLQSGDAGLAVAASDIVPVPKARSVAVLYDNVGHLLVRQDSAIARFADLKGKRIALPQASDDYRVFLALAKFYGLGENDFVFVGGDQNAADVAFLNRESDAFFRLQSAGSPYIKRIVTQTGANLVPIGDGGAVKVLSPGYQTETIPRAVYRSDPPVPSSDTQTISTRRVLYARGDLDPAVVVDLAGVLFQRRADLAAALPKDAADLRHIAAAARKPPATSFDAAVHPGVDAFNRADLNSFFVRYGMTMILLLAGSLISVPAVLEWRRAQRRRQKFELDRYNSRLADLLDKSRSDRSKLDENLRTLGLQAIDDLKRDKLSPEGFAAFQAVVGRALARAEG